MKIGVYVIFATHLMAMSLLAFCPQVLEAAETREPVFVKATCEGKLSAAVLSELRAQIEGSQKFRIAETVQDEGRMDIVLAVYMHCKEENQTVAIATVYGKARCLSLTKCHLSIDGSSIRSDLCDAKTGGECGKALFKALDNFVNNPFKPPLVF